MTLQEKMNEIYELTGSEPDWWADDGILYPDQEPEYASSKPHYTESKLWEMLPTKISLHELQVDAVCFEVCYRYYYLDTDDKVSCTDLVSCGFMETSLHEALVDMVLWCISEGHIEKKGENDEQTK